MSEIGFIWINSRVIVVYLQAIKVLYLLMKRHLGDKVKKVEAYRFNANDLKF